LYYPMIILGFNPVINCKTQALSTKLSNSS
jgi:hypothetical protein